VSELQMKHQDMQLSRVDECALDASVRPSIKRHELVIIFAAATWLTLSLVSGVLAGSRDSCETVLLFECTKKVHTFPSRAAHLFANELYRKTVYKRFSYPGLGYA
jgi:hypothetical protein